MIYINKNHKMNKKFYTIKWFKIQSKYLNLREIIVYLKIAVNQ